MKQTNEKFKNKLPMIMKMEGKYEAYENGQPTGNVSMKADYDGDDLEVNIMDKLKNKETYLQLSNDQLFDLMSHNHTEQSLIKQLEHEVKVKPIKSKSVKKKNENKKKNKKKSGKKTQRKKSNGKKGKKGKQTRRKK